MRILIVCLGSICRSPAAEAMLRAKLAAARIPARVDSAGTGDWHLGKPPHPPMIAAAARAGHDLEALHVRLVTARDSDLILAADPSNPSDIERLRPPGNATSVRLLAPYAGQGNNTVPDSFQTGDYADALTLIEAACDRLVRQLQ